jgi:uncharacterized protein (DUF2164 family)
MKYKTLTKEQILISLDRLTRFKPTKEKYIRVFSDIVFSNLIEPVYKKNDIVPSKYSLLKSYAQTIINESIHFYANEKISDFTINNRIAEYENTVFINDEEAIDFLNNQIDYKSAVKLIDGNCVGNLKWLRSLQSEYIDLGHTRAINYLKYPISEVFLVEGLTAEILLPAFSKYLGYDFYQKGIQIIPAGGKNQVVKMYYSLIEQIKIPIFVLLDKDAEENIRQITPKLRDIDKIHLVSCGEFEDLLPMSLIIKTVNKELSNFATISVSEFDSELSTAKNLELIFKTKGLHEFKKADFAKQVKNNICEKSDISAEIQNIITELFQ